MEKKKYESPKFGFQEMKLTEKVADTCWGTGGNLNGTHKGWYDFNNNGQVDLDDKPIIITINIEGKSSCKDVEDALIDQIKKYVNDDILPASVLSTMSADAKTNVSDKDSHIILPIS